MILKVPRNGKIKRKSSHYEILSLHLRAMVLKYPLFSFAQNENIHKFLVGTFLML